MADKPRRGRKPYSETNGHTSLDGLNERDRSLVKAGSHVKMGGMVVERFSTEYKDKREKNLECVRRYREEEKKREMAVKTEIENGIRECKKSEESINAINFKIQEGVRRNDFPNSYDPQQIHDYLAKTSTQLEQLKEQIEKLE